MINALFLSCALAASPAIAYPQETSGAAIRLITDSAILSNRLLRNERRILIVGEVTAWVKIFRSHGLFAFGVLPYQDSTATPYHVVASRQDLPFFGKAFQTIYWRLDNPLGKAFINELLRVLSLVEPTGFFVFDENIYPDWAIILKQFAWQRAPFKLENLSVWENRQNSDYLLRRRLPQRMYKPFRRAIETCA